MDKVASLFGGLIVGAGATFFTLAILFIAAKYLLKVVA